MSLEPHDKIKYYNFWDKKHKIYGIAYVKKGFEAFLHRHKEPEIYYFLWGSGQLKIDDNIYNKVS